MDIPNRKIITLALAALLTFVLATGCSTQKNTASHRRWHAFTANYNIYYNGTLAYIDGSLEKENGNKDNFTEMIPLYTVGNKNSRELGKGNFDRAIEKCEKAIRLHSIKRRPVWDKKRRKTERDIEWLNRKEYNPFLWKAWLLMGRSQFHEGDFDAAASTFAYMSRLYQTQPAIYGRARAWLAKCYIEQGWLYDAEDVIRNMQRDSIHWRARKEWDYTMADYYIHTGEYEKAIPSLRKVIKHEMRRKQKAREWFLLGQLYEAVGNKPLAYKAYRHVTRLNPPYEVEFNARIAMTEVMASGQARKMIGKLKRMARSDNNKEYLDQVYYAIGNIYLTQKDTISAIRAYEEGNSKATRSGIEKGVLLLKLGDLYWAKEKFSDARRCYGEAIGLLDKERPDYEQLSNRSKVLDELVPFTEAVHLQDSLQTLAKMSDKDRNAAIDRVIEALKKKEKEEARAKADQESANQGGNTGNDMDNGISNRSARTTQNSQSTQKTTWYFYNTMAVNQGKTEFERLWGKRANEDNWQRSNKTVVASAQDQQDNTEEGAEETGSNKEETASDPLDHKTDSAVNDPHKREYYLAQIPFTEEQLKASNATIMDGLYHAGVIFKDKLDNLSLSEKCLQRINLQYPTYEHMDDVFYHLFLLYSRRHETAQAAAFLDRLKKDWPKSQWTALLSDPAFAENARFGVHMEDSLYAATYEAFKADRYDEVAANSELSARRYPLGANRDKFLFIGALGKLNAGNADGCLDDLKQVVEKYPQSSVSEMAGMIINGVSKGRRLRGGKFDVGDVWSRRSVVLNDSDSIQARTFSTERNTNFVFMLVYSPDSINENQLLFRLAKYNFTSYLVRNFDLTIEDADGLHRLKISGFRNYDEALQYARAALAQQQIKKLVGKARSVIISETNLPLLGQQFSYDDYDKFYARHFAPLKISSDLLLDEPEEITTVRPDNDKEPARPDLIDNGIFIDDSTPASQQGGGTTIVTDDAQNKKTSGTIQGGLTIPTEQSDKGTSVKQQGTIIPDTPKATVKQQGTIIPDTPKSTVKQQGTIIPDTPKSTPKQQGTIIPDTPESTPKQQGTIIPDTPESAPKKQEDRTSVIIQKETSPDKQTPVKQPVKSQPQKVEQTKQPVKQEQKAQEQKKQETKKQQNDDGIYFDDSDIPSTPKNDNKKDKKKELEPDIDLEDEYYDLDGF